MQAKRFNAVAASRNRRSAKPKPETESAARKNCQAPQQRSTRQLAGTPLPVSGTSGQARRTLHRRAKTPSLRNRAAQKHPPVASASAAMFERRRTACHETRHPPDASLAKTGSRTACVQGL